MTDHLQPADGPHDHAATKWCMLAIVSLGFIVMTINWFNVSTGFGPIAAEFNLTIPKVAFLISIFVATYGICHIPGGFLATRWGMRRVLALGLAIEGTAAILSATSQTFGQLVLWRAASGVGASIFAAVGVAAVSIWFRERHHALALGVSSAAFSVGTALGLYTWADITNATSWRTSLVYGGIFCLAVAAVSGLFFRVPRGVDALYGVRLTFASLQQTLGNRTIWISGAAFLGAYGAYIAASQLIAGYGGSRHFDAGQVSTAAFLIGIAGVPGSIFAGWVADRYLSPQVLFVIGAVLEGLFLVSLPLTDSTTFWIAAFGIGFMFNFTFAVWQTVPGTIGTIAPENIGTAVGLMLSIAAIGGFVLPEVFGHMVPRNGYPAAWTMLGIASIVTALISFLNYRRASSAVLAPASVAETGGPA